MKFPLHVTSLALVLVCLVSVEGQKRRPSSKAKTVETGNAAVVIDETLSVLRSRPSLFAEPVQRMRRGRRVQILGATDADGVRFYKVSVPPARMGWVQAEAVVRKSRAGDEERLARLVQASDGFGQIELARTFLNLYPASQLRPHVLLILGDLLEEVAAKLSRDATSRLSRREMAASGAPIHSYYLNFNMIDRYRRLGVVFLFNPSTRSFHYDGACWKEIARRFSATTEAEEAAKRLASLELKMNRMASN